MHLLSKQSIIVCLAVLCPTTACGESNIDFFFKDRTKYKDVIVKEIRSTNTLVIKENVGERGEIIKLIGLRALKSPKNKLDDIDRDQYGFTVKKPISPLTPLEDQAFDFVKELLEGQHVRLEFDADKKAKDHATLAYVFLLKDNTFVNTEILRHGFAHLQISPPNTKYAQELRNAYKEARIEKRGLQGQ